jgi:hypothetical protein
MILNGSSYVLDDCLLSSTYLFHQVVWFAEVLCAY